MTARSERTAARIPWMILLLVFGILVARWIWVARCNSDFGWTYEPAWRIAHGQAPYRDFIHTQPMIAPYIIAGLIKLLGDSLWAFQISLYLSWLGIMAVGLAIINLLEASISLRTACLVAASSFSFPFILGTQVHSYQGPLCAGLVVYFFLKYLKSWAPWEIFAAGCFTGLAVFAKQNAGLFIGAAAGAALLLSFFLSPRSIGKCVRDAICFMAGGAIVSSALMAFLSYRAGMKEVFMEMFIDASVSKGRPLTILARGLPRIVLDPAIPHRRLAELVISAGLLAASCMALSLFLAKRNQKAKHPEQGGAGRGEFAGAEKPAFRPELAVWLGVMIILWTVTLFDLPQVRLALEALHPRLILANNWVEAAGEFAYIGAMSAALSCAWLILKRRAEPGLLFPCIFLVGISYGSLVSNFAYFPYAAPIAIPLLIHILARLRFPRLRECAAYSAVVFLIVASLFPMNAETTFCKLVPLPKHSPFAGLYADPELQQWVDVQWRGLSPMIRGQRTLWLLHGDPHSAFGGIPVLNVVTIDGESYSSRSEARLWSAWQQDPPEFVVLGPFTRARNAKLLQEDEVNRWLASQYALAWKDPRNLLTLWKLKERGNTLSQR